MSIRILLAESNKILRETLRISFEKRNDDMEIIAEAEDGSTAVKLVEELKPDVVIMGCALPELNGIDATRRIISKFPDIKVVALSMHTDRRSVSGMLKAGASGFLIRNCSFGELCQAIRDVFAQKIYLSPEIMTIVVQEFVGIVSRKDYVPFSFLTPKEHEVLKLLVEGKTAKQIASALKVNVKTVETHKLQLMNKLGVRNIAELTKFALREGLTSLEGGFDD